MLIIGIYLLLSRFQLSRSVGEGLQYTENLRQTYDLAIDNVNVLGCWNLRKARHTHHLASDGHDELGTLVDDDILNVEVEAGRGTHALWIGGERVLGLGYADREVVEA